MAEMITMYTDAKNKVHTVQHVTPAESPEKQQMTEELFRLLSRIAARQAEIYSSHRKEVRHGYRTLRTKISGA